MPFLRHRLSKDEQALALHMSGNVALYEAFKKVIESRLSGRLLMVEPTNPNDCRAILARNAECKWFLSLLERVFKAPALSPSDSEQPQ